jgi:hypothetical protein
MTSPTKRGSCPFSTRKGFSTAATRQEYLKVHPECMDNVDESLDADLDTSKPLYFWQIYSIWGKHPIVDICTDFYGSIYAVEDDAKDRKEIEFKNVFQKLAPKRHHINAQVAFWADAMGGGRLYHGGSHRLLYHHSNNAGERVMNADGAKLWMHHMKVAIKNNHFHFQKDPRILPCLIDFLETKMMFYADFHDWDFDKGDFSFQDFLPDRQQDVSS